MFWIKALGYKGCDQIGLMMDAMKSILGADSSYMRSKKTIEGWMFTTFIGLWMVLQDILYAFKPCRRF